MINFCAPFIDNDYSLRLNRGVQLSVLVFLLLVYVANYVQIYLKEKSEKDLEEQTEGVSKPSCDKNQ